MSTVHSHVRPPVDGDHELAILWRWTGSCGLLEVVEPEAGEVESVADVQSDLQGAGKAVAAVERRGVEGVEGDPRRVLWW